MSQEPNEDQPSKSDRQSWECYNSAKSVLEERRLHGYMKDEAVVLLVGEDEFTTNRIRRVLEREGDSVQIVPGPSEGLELLEAGGVDLLCLDLRWGEPTHDQFAASVVQRFPETGILYISTLQDAPQAVRSIRSGIDGFILKPIEDEALFVSTVQSALERRRQQRDYRRLQALRPLLDLNSGLFSTTDLDQLIQNILDWICEHLQCSQAGIYARKPGKSNFEPVATRGLTQMVDAESSAANPISWAGAQSIPVILSRFQASPDLERYLVEHQLGALICAPVAMEKEAYVFCAFRGEGERSFNKTDLAVLSVLAKQAAAAMENAHLYSELQSSIRKAEASQKALIQAEKLATAGRLTASIAHEINNPLQAVQNCLHLAGRKELSADERQKYLELAQDELDRLMSTTQRMLDFYRPVALARRPTDINILIQRVMLLLGQQLDQARIQVHASLAENLPKVDAVADQIHQVLLNLVINSIEAMPKGGELHIKTESSSEAVLVWIEDSGPGIPPDERERIFEPLTSSKNQGIGIGLSVSYGIITAHGGNLEYIDQNGHGACFRITLPVADR